MAPKENKKPEGLRDALKEVAKGNVNQPVRGGITEPGQQGLGILPVGQQQAEKPAGGGLDKHTKYGPEDPAGAATDAAKAGSGAVSNKLGEGGIPNLQDGVKPLAGGMAAIADRKVRSIAPRDSGEQ